MLRPNAPFGRNASEFGQNVHVLPENEAFVWHPPPARAAGHPARTQRAAKMSVAPSDRHARARPQRGAPRNSGGGQPAEPRPEECLLLLTLRACDPTVTSRFCSRVWTSHLPLWQIRKLVNGHPVHTDKCVCACACLGVFMCGCLCTCTGIYVSLCAGVSECVAHMHT